MAGDALEPESLARAFDSIEELDAVISTVGGTSSNPRVDGEVLPTIMGPATNHDLLVRYLRHHLLMRCLSSWRHGCDLVQTYMCL